MCIFHFSNATSLYTLSFNFCALLTWHGSYACSLDRWVKVQVGEVRVLLQAQAAVHIYCWKFVYILILCLSLEIFNLTHSHERIILCSPNLYFLWKYNFFITFSNSYPFHKLPVLNFFLCLKNLNFRYIFAIENVFALT